MPSVYILTYTHFLISAQSLCFFIFFYSVSFSKHDCVCFLISQYLKLVPFQLFHRLPSLKDPNPNFIAFVPSGQNDTSGNNNNCYLFVYNIVTTINLELMDL